MTETNWRGCKNIKMRYYNDWATPDILYNGYEFPYYDIEDALWYDFCEETGHVDSQSGETEVEEEFNLYVQDNAEDYLEDVLAGGYFEKDKTSWHKKKGDD